MSETATAATTAAAQGPSAIPPALRFAAENFIDEYSSAWLYRELALLCKTDKQRERLEEFARYEDRHAEAWAKILDARGVARPAGKTVRLHRWWLRLAEVAGVLAVMPLI